MDNGVRARKDLRRSAYLKRVVGESIGDLDDEVHACSICEAIPAAPISSVVEVVEAAIDRFYLTATDAGMPWDEGAWVFPTMDTLDVIEDLGGFDDWNVMSGVADRLDQEDWVRRDDPRASKSVRLSRGWTRFADHVSHVSRYLLAPPDPRDDLDPDPELDPTEVLPLVATAIWNEFDLLEELSGDTLLYRARTFDDEFPFSNRHELVSPPPDRASQGRMNGAGISVLYAALDEETAASEVYDGKEFVAVVRLRPTRPLTVVDLTKVPELARTTLRSRSAVTRTDSSCCRLPIRSLDRSCETTACITSTHRRRCLRSFCAGGFFPKGKSLTVLSIAQRTAPEGTLFCLRGPPVASPTVICPTR